MKQAALRIAGGSLVVLAGAFAAFQWVVEGGHKMDPSTWNWAAWVAAVVMLCGGAVAVIAITSYAWGELKGRRTRVELSAEHAPGIAQIRVRNLGRADSFVAVARLLEVREFGTSDRLPLTFNLGWMGCGGYRADLSRGGVDTLLVVSTERLPAGPLFPSPQSAMELWGWEGGEKSLKGYYCWVLGDVDAPVITLEVEVIAQSSSRSVRHVFSVGGLPSGTVSIQRCGRDGAGGGGGPERGRP